MANSVNDFKSKLVGGGARPNLFYVNCTFPANLGGNSNQAQFLIKSASLPSAKHDTITVPYRGRQLKIPGDRTFDQWTIKVINDTTFGLRNAFENWIDIVNPAAANSGTTNMDAYMSQIDIVQLDKSGNPIKSYGLVGAFPASVGAIELSYDTNNAIEEFDVTFEYQYFLSNSTVFTGAGGGSSAGPAGIPGLGSLLSALKSGIKNVAVNAAAGAVNSALGRAGF